MLRKACLVVGSLLLVFSLIKLVWLGSRLGLNPGYTKLRLGALIYDLVYFFQALALALLCFFAAHELKLGDHHD